MKNYQELEIKVIKIIEDMKIPQEIKSKLNKYYENYYDACDSYIKKMRKIEEENSYYLKKDAERDYEGDVEAIEATLDGAYAIKKDKILNLLLNELQYITENKEGELDIVLFDTNQEEKEYIKNKDRYKIDKIINNRTNNETFIEIVKKEITSELLSSKKYILQKGQSQNFGISDMEKRIIIEDAKKKFEEDVDGIVQKIETDFPEIGKALTIQDREIYQAIIEAIEEYKIERKSKETKFFNEQRKKFVEENRQGVSLDEKLAQETLQEKETDYTKPLDGNIID